MKIDDKVGVIGKVRSGELIELELGCGNRKRHASAIGIDALDYPCVDIVGDIFDVLSELPNGCVSRVYSYHFLEHVDATELLISELVRVVMPSGQMDIVVPHFSNPYFYSDPTHTRTFGLYTMSYFGKESLFRRRVPSYGKDFPIEVIEVELGFKSDSSFPFQYGIKKVFGLLFNSANFMKEFYEAWMPWIITCYEVRYRVVRR